MSGIAGAFRLALKVITLASLAVAVALQLPDAFPVGLHSDWFSTALAFSVSIGGIALMLFLTAQEKYLAASVSGVIGVFPALASVAGHLLAYNSLPTPMASLGAALVHGTDLPLSLAIAISILGIAGILDTFRVRISMTPEAIAAAGVVIAIALPGTLLVQQFDAWVMHLPIIRETLLTGDGVLVMALAIGMIMQALDRADIHFDVFTRFLPIFSFLVLLTTSFALWLLIVGQQHQSAEDATRQASEQLRETVEGFYEARAEALQRMADRIGSGVEAGSRDLWHADALAYLRDFESLGSIGWINANGVVQWATTREIDHYLEGESFAVDELRARILTAARETGQKQYSTLAKLRSDGMGQLIVIPIDSGNSFKGWLVTGVRYREFFDDGRQ